ncbi:hypothetical protein [Povalibacter sp.]|uniref:hypothetical protein n=1 Tax=Povalibacter sp. TaxID=1962978 RepID=UPI002F41D8A2
MTPSTLTAAAALSLACSPAFAGGLNPPGPGAQISGATTTPSTTSTVSAAATVTSLVTNSGGASGLATAIGALAGATVSGNIVTSPPISMGSTTVTLSVNTSSGIVTVLRSNGTVILTVNTGN